MVDALKSNDCLDSEVVEWIDGERIPLREYELRLEAQARYKAGLYLLELGNELNWIFGMDATS